MAFITGNTLTETINLLDSLHNPVTGATFTTLLKADPDGTAFALSYAELG